MMKAKWLLMGLVLVVGMVAALSVLPGVLSAQDTMQCRMQFNATVYQGPSAGLSLDGVLEMDIDPTGGVTGKFVLLDTTEVPVAGQVNGRAVSLIFTVSEDKYIYGVGTSLTNMMDETCGTTLGGPFVGPEEGDSGDWKPKGKPKPGTLN